MRRAAAALAGATALAIAGCGGSSHPSACTQYHTHVRAQQRNAAARGEKVARNVAVSLGEPASHADPRLAKDTAQAYLDSALAHDKRPANCQ